VAQQTLYNGVRFSFTDLAVEGETAQVYGSIPFFFPKGVVQGINWAAAQDKGIVQGNQIGRVGVTSGYGVGSGSIELLVSEADDWLSQITQGGFYPAMTVFFNLRITYSVNGGTDTRQDTLVGCTITNIAGNNQRGNDATTTPFELSIAGIYKAGVLLFGDPVA